MPATDSRMVTIDRARVAYNFVLVREPDKTVLALCPDRGGLEPMRTLLAMHGVRAEIRPRKSAGAAWRNGESYASFRERSNKYVRERRKAA